MPGPNCKSPSKGYLTAVNYRYFLKVKIKSVIFFALKTLFPKFLNQVCFTSFSVNYAINPITENVLDILLYEKIVLSSIIAWLVNCNYSSTFDNFSALCHENKTYFLELKESLLIIRDRPSKNENIRVVPLYPFEWVLITLFAALCELTFFSCIS